MRVVVALVVSALVLTACGGGDETPSAATDSTTTEAPATTTAAVDVAVDKAEARKLLLRSSDLPAGWKAAPTQRDSVDKALDDQVAACAGRPRPASRITARADSQTFTMDYAEAGSQAELVRTVEDFKADVAATKGPKYAPCVRRALIKFLPQQLPPGASVQSVVVERLPVAHYGEFSAGFRATVKLLVQGQPARVYQDAVLLGKGRVELSAGFSNVQEPFDPALEQELVAKLASRLEAA